ncbi:unnamed protein product [Cylindrotheca closterium]|uniref:Uncharacterized protein n=1 Tax=Cylindrotheca closterium TaxID=2856 RepID=A0AAD2FP80_9STRA|nr:unnamed protein product [Cylindrotheca closterium]
MAFGRLTTKWRFFCSNLNFYLEKNIRICNVALHRHNFVIDQQEIEDLGSLEGTETTDQLRTMGGIEQFSDPRSPNNLGFLPNHEDPEQLAERPPQNNQQDEGMDDLMDGMEDETSVIYTNLSRHNSILDYIQDLELERPDKNRSRNNN